ncbi:hypothetical protein QQF64_026049 [Cirrhinus molitorella]|uniref:Uncharacterized protein n=1 Tax=Cirrhinus molitorella TaxID=172907 RepID=A0ABR3NRF8_9TELE
MITETEVCQTAGSLFREIMIMLKTAVFAAPTVILLQIICERRAGEFLSVSQSDDSQSALMRDQYMLLFNYFAERKKQHREEI